MINQSQPKLIKTYMPFSTIAVKLRLVMSKLTKKKKIQNRKISYSTISFS